MIRKAEYVCVVLLGGVIYGSLEMLWRGFTHPSMILAGGVCFLLIHLLNHNAKKVNLVMKCIIGSAIITAVEFSVGVVVNILLGLDVWDYSALPLNILGQVCPQFMLLWFILSFPANYISGWIRAFFNVLEKREKQTV